ncbi:MAG: 2Fe-2S iron-sulfur cluster-binding protein [Candidatus Gracilibacteria bacterium]
MVTVVIKLPNGKEFTSYKANGKDTILEQLESYNIDFPYSCRAGACMTCCVVVKQGMEFLDPFLGGDKFIDTDDDQFLSCIGGVKQEFVDDEENHIVEIEVMDADMLQVNEEELPIKVE